MSEVRYLVSGDSSVCVEFGNEISPDINRKIRAFKIAVEKLSLIHISSGTTSTTTAAWPPTPTSANTT